MKSTDSRPIFWSSPFIPVVWIHFIDVHRIIGNMTAQYMRFLSLIVENDCEEMVGMVDYKSHWDNWTYTITRDGMVPPEELDFFILHLSCH
jgi:hypothetical protein